MNKGWKLIHNVPKNERTFSINCLLSISNESQPFKIILDFYTKQGSMLGGPHILKTSNPNFT
jgi:hypothetical protein